MTDPNTPTTSTNPQDLIDQALGSATTSVSTPTDPTEPTLPTPEPLSPPPATEPMVEQQKPEVEPTNAVPEPTMMPEPPKDVKPMSDDMPLAFANVVTSDTPKVESPVSNISIEQITPAQVPPILTTPSTTDIGSAKPKKRSTKLVAMVVAIFMAFSIIGSLSYQMFTGENIIALVATKKPKDITSQADCNGQSNGGWLVWRNGECKVTGISGNTTNPDKNTENPNIQNANTQTGCEGSGGFWCTGTDASGQPYSFCGSNTNGKACYQQAIDKGITVQIGNVACVQTPDGLGWVPDPSMKYNNDPNGVGAVNGKSVHQQVYEQCQAQKGSFTALGNKEMWLCPKGTTVACTSNVPGAKRFYGNPSGCFCGVIQVDTGTGHTSYSSTCGCDKPEATLTPSTPTVTVTPTLMCTGLTHTPTTTPVVGDKLTFTCAGSSTPAGAVNLTYKFRYNLNNGAYVSMTNKTATTSELTIASCGTYKVQCQACGTINGVLTCDPTWTTATQ